MITRFILYLFLVLAVCSFCEVDFKCLGRHVYRCKYKPKNKKSADETVQPLLDINSSNKNNFITCSCGKKCKGLRGLKMHHRSCRVIKDLITQMNNDEEVSSEEPEINEPSNEIITEHVQTLPEMKAGIILPRSENQWNEANSFFQTSLPISDINRNNINECAIKLNNTVYDYFASSFGKLKKNDNSEFATIYKDFNKKDLTKELKQLKHTNDDPVKIRYVSRLLRSKIAIVKTDVEVRKDQNELTDHNECCKRNLWSYAKKFIERKKYILPTFNRETCYKYFEKTLKVINRLKIYYIPNWIPGLNEPTFQFNMEPPTYAKVTRIIRKMKSSGSPCPLDQIPSICFKRSPYLRSYITALISEIWNSGNIPDHWKRAVTILIYKKGSPDNPENFRPITLETIPLKIFTACIRDAIFEFAMKNKYIDCDLQKGFLPKISGTFEHTSHMAHIINQARLKQRSLVITLLDLKNAFGLVRHNLISTVLRYHHIPESIENLVSNLYNDFNTSIMTKEFSTPFIKVENGVLQGDCLSPLLFNLCFNTFLNYIKSEQFMQLGYSVHSKLKPRHWFQFADDASVVTGSERENQILLSAFTKWCVWADMIVRVDKCKTFGIKKFNSVAKQYKPKVFVNNQTIPPVDIRDYFTYLGRHFNFEMNDHQHKEELSNTINEIMSDINNLPLHPKYKIQLYKSYVLSKISWHLTVTDISITWVKQNVDNVVHDYIRRWLEIPISGTLDICMLSKSKFGLDIIEPSTKFIQCQFVIRNKMKTSVNDDIQQIYFSTSKGRNLQYDQFSNTREIIKEIRKKKSSHIENKLTSQGFTIRAIWNEGFKNMCQLWPTVQAKLPKNIFNFTVRYLNNTLPNNTNMSRWKLADTPLCSRCLKPESLMHVVAGCTVYLVEKRFNWRHDSILLLLAKFLSSINNVKLYFDIPGYDNPEMITEDQRPDALLIKEGANNHKEIIVLELTVGYETNMSANTNRKNAKYQQLLDNLNNKYSSVTYVNLSMSALGFYGQSCNTFKETLTRLNVREDSQNFIIKRMSQIAIRTTYFIFCRRNKTWNDPALMDL